MKHLKKFMYYFNIELFILLSFFLCDKEIDFHKKTFSSLYIPIMNKYQPMNNKNHN